MSPDWLRANLATIAQAALMIAFGALMLVISQLPSPPAERTYHTRPANDSEIQQHELDQQTAQLLADMEAAR